MPTLEENTARFEQLLRSVERPGVDNLLNYLHSGTDFFTAPASTHFHLACSGGLLQHSLNVYDCLAAKKESPIWKEALKDVSGDSLILIGLLHDLCKVNYYKSDSKNQKTYDPAKVEAAADWQRKHDEKGDFVWESVPCYKVEEEMPLGHGEKSVILAQCYLKLNLDEAMAIRWHMGFSEDQSKYKSLDRALEKYPVVLAAIEADLEAAKLLERESINKNGQA